MIRFFSILLAVLLLAVAGAGLAQHDPDQDVYVTVDSEPTNELAEDANLGEVGEVLFNVQESAQRQLSRRTGFEADYFYVWVCTGDECVPVDPVRFRN